MVSARAGLQGDKKDYAEPVRKLLNVPDAYTLVSLLPAGFAADITLPEKKDYRCGYLLWISTTRIETPGDRDVRWSWICLSRIAINRHRIAVNLNPHDCFTRI